MATEESVSRWKYVLSDVITIFDSIPSVMWSQPAFPLQQAAMTMVGVVGAPILQAWDADRPREGTDLYEWIKPLVDAARAMDPTEMSKMPILAYFNLAKETRSRIDTIEHTEIAEAVVDEMFVALKVIILTARLGHQGIMQLIDTQWEPRLRASRSGDIPAVAHFDTLRVEMATDPSMSTIPFLSCSQASIGDWPHGRSTSLNTIMNRRRRLNNVSQPCG